METGFAAPTQLPPFMACLPGGRLVLGGRSRDIESVSPRQRMEQSAAAHRTENLWPCAECGALRGLLWEAVL